MGNINREKINNIIAKIFFNKAFNLFNVISSFFLLKYTSYVSLYLLRIDKKGGGAVLLIIFSAIFIGCFLKVKDKKTHFIELLIIFFLFIVSAGVYQIGYFIFAFMLYLSSLLGSCIGAIICWICSNSKRTANQIERKNINKIYSYFYPVLIISYFISLLCCGIISYFTNDQIYMIIIDPPLLFIAGSISGFLENKGKMKLLIIFIVSFLFNKSLVNLLTNFYYFYIYHFIGFGSGNLIFDLVDKKFEINDLTDNKIVSDNLM